MSGCRVDFRGGAIVKRQYKKPGISRPSAIDGALDESLGGSILRHVTSGPAEVGCVKRNRSAGHTTRRAVFATRQHNRQHDDVRTGQQDGTGGRKVGPDDEVERVEEEEMGHRVCLEAP